MDVSDLRMEKAQAMLRDGRRNVGEIARAVGYRDPNYFSKAFKKHVGCAPRDVRLSAMDQPMD